MTSTHSYVLDNAAVEAPARLDALAAMYDPGTRRRLTALGVRAGWHCLEIGGGNGSVASWLADSVGASGRVVVTDIDTRHLEALSRPNLEVRRHDVVADALPQRAFDLVHVRLVLVHLAEWQHVLRKLIDALTPGGWLVAEEFDSDSLQPDPVESPGEVVLRAHVGLARVMRDNGFDRRCGRRLYARFRELGLMNVGAEARLEMLRAGTPGAALLRANYEQLRRAIVDGGDVSEAEMSADMVRLEDPAFMMPSSIMWTVWGQGS